MIEREDLTRYKPRLRDYLSNRGVEIIVTDKPRISCLNPSAHGGGDAHASMIIYDEILYCPVCGVKMDVFEAAQIIAGLPSGPKEFPRVIDEVKSYLGEASTLAPAPAAKAAAPAKKPRAERNTSFVSLDLEAAGNYYVKSQILSIAEKSLRWRPPEITQTWKSMNPDGTLALVECRFEGHPDGKKKYLTYWFDGAHLRAKDPPYLLYNRDKLAANPEVEFAIHEGPKSIFGVRDKDGNLVIAGAEAIPGFIPTGWNSGGKKLGLVDFEPLRGRTGVFYPDDDEPGRKTAREVKQILEENYGCTVRIVEPLAEARAIKSEGADIVEALQVRTPEEMAEYLRSGPALGALAPEREVQRDETIQRTADHPKKPDHEERESNNGNQHAPAVTPPRPPASIPIRQPSAVPFRILGTADDGLTYFVDAEEHLQRYRLTSLTKGMLLVLAPLPWWYANFGAKKGVDWDDATDFMIRTAAAIDFDPETIRGAGAWREKDGRACYNTGHKVIGQPDPTRLYLRRSEKDIGLEDEPAPFEVRREMYEAAAAMSFETPADCVRLLAWSILAPFGGALPWRPAGFITGESKAGKSTAINLIARALSCAEVCSGMDSTSAGIRQKGRWSSTPVVIDEAGDDTEKALRNRAEIFSLMRQSTGGDAPKAWKGTIDGLGQTFDLSQMFLFAAINPIVNSSADANRLFFVNMVKAAGGTWKPVKRRVEAAFKEPKCRAVRAWVWAHLEEIILEADRITDAVEEIGKRSSRDAYLDAILFSAHFLTFKDHAPSDTELERFILETYKIQPSEEKVDEAEALVDRILDEVVAVSGDRTKMYSLRRVLYGIKYEKGPTTGTLTTLDGMEGLVPAELAAFRTTAIQYGLGIDPEGNLAIVNNHHMIGKISGLGKGYARLLKRHPLVVDSCKVVNFAKLGDKSRRCTTFKGVLETDEIPF